MSTVRSRFTFEAVKGVAIIIGLTLSFFFAIELMGAGFASASSRYVNSLIQIASNPFITLFIGLLATAILQSSSTTTTMSVALVATEAITVEQAIPLVIGANIGTTITSTLVSLGYITRTAEFRKAVSAGVCHDVYNIIMAILILPLELKYQILSKASRYLTEQIPILYENKKGFEGVAEIFSPISEVFIGNFGWILTLIISWVLLFTSLKMISNLLYKKWIGNTKEQFDKAIFNKKYKSYGVGLLLTSAVQSSSLTTSLMVPLAATGKVNITKAFYFVLGANLGTTLTAIIAALFRSEAAMSLAMAHFLFNLTGSILFVYVPFFPRLTTFLSDKLGIMTLKNRLVGFSYIIFTFFLIPFGLIYFSSSKPNLHSNTQHVAISSVKTVSSIEE